MAAINTPELLGPDFNNGAIPALRGYRVQFLDTLRRVLQSGVGEVVFPELKEDYSVTKDGVLAEVVQVKNLSSPLVVSSLSPSSEDSFFNRCLGLLEKAPTAKLKLVSVGELGGDFQDLAGGDSSTIYRKLTGKYGYDKEATKLLVSRLEIVMTTEDEITQITKSLLDETIVGGDVGTALDLMLLWMYQLAEQQRTTTRDEVIKKYNEIGLFFSERRQYLQQFGRSVLPLSSGPEEEAAASQVLEQEYFSGVAARYKHIGAGLDLRRPIQVDKIRTAFEEESTVILHGASGQGKSTLGYRYAHDYYPKGYAFEILLTESDDSVLEIRQAVEALSRPYNSPFLMLVDVPPGNNGWEFLVRRLVDIKQCHVLVTIREEDLNRSANIAEFNKAGSIKLALHKGEAEDLFLRLRKDDSVPHFLNFSDAWLKFGEKGPFLEFAYLLRRGERLKERLENQLKRLEDETETTGSADKMYLLRQVVFAGAHDCRLDLKRMASLKGGLNYEGVIQQLKEEYLVRTSENGQFLEVLHPIRAKLMMELMTDPILRPAEATFFAALPYLASADLGVFVLQYGYHYGWNDKIQKALYDREVISWRVGKEIFRSLIWCGVRNFMFVHAALFERLASEYPMAKDIALMLHFAPGSSLSTFESFIPADKLTELRRIFKGFAELDTTYTYAYEWLGSCRFEALTEKLSANEADGLGYLLFWMGKAKIVKQLTTAQFTQISLSETGETSLASWANLLLGLNTYDDRGPSDSVIAIMTPSFISQLREKYQLFSFEEREDEIEVGMLIDITDEGVALRREEGGRHKKVIEVLELIRKAIPNKEIYECQGYGHQMSELPMAHDETHKRLSKSALRPKWETDNFQFLLNLNKWGERPTDWSKLIGDLTQKRAETERFFQGLKNGLRKLCKRKRIKSVASVVPEFELASATFPLPKEAVDRLGFTGDSVKAVNMDGLIHNVPLLLYISPELPEAIKSIKNFYSSLQNFVNQGTKSIALKQSTTSWTDKDWEVRADELRDMGYAKDNLRMSIYNLEKLEESAPKYLQALAYLRAEYGAPRQDEGALLSLLSELRILWPYFINRPLGGGYDLLRSSQLQEEKVLDKIFTSLEIATTVAAKEAGAIKSEVIFSDRVKGNWYILFYVEDWATALHVLGYSRPIIAEAIDELPHGSFERSVADKHVDRIWVIPIHGNYLINRQAASFKLYDVANLEKDMATTVFNLATEISDEIVADLDVLEARTVFAHMVEPELLGGRIRKVMVFASHLGQLNKVSVSGDEGRAILMRQVDKVFPVIETSYDELEASLNLCVDDFHQELEADDSWLHGHDISAVVASMVQSLIPFEEIKEVMKQEDRADYIIPLFQDWSKNLYGVEERINEVSLAWLNVLVLRYLRFNRKSN